jgi:hypothetical protein
MISGLLAAVLGLRRQLAMAPDKRDWSGPAWALTASLWATGVLFDRLTGACGPPGSP